MSERPLWQPTPARADATQLAAFATAVGRPDYAELHRWSVDDPAAFWSTAWDWCGVVGEKGDVALLAADELWQARFFPGARLNYARNLLRRDDDTDALVFAREDGLRSRTTWRELHASASRVEQALRSAGIGVGDRVAALLPNAPEAYVLMLATAAVGATFSSCSPDFGPDGVVDRFGQIEPRLLVAVDGYLYGGKHIDCRDKVDEVRRRLPTVEHTVVVEYVDRYAVAGDDVCTWADWLAPYEPAPVHFEDLPFDHPLFVLYSSGTTGLPKCIVHGAGRVLLKLLVEHRLHFDVRPDERLFWFTTTGWMMWNWLATAMASEATLVVFDGSPTHPAADSMWALAAEVGIDVFGTSARFLDACDKAGLRPGADHDLSSVRAIGSTGSVLSPRSFDFVYERVKADVHLASISGGTDLCGALVGGNPTGPVWRGEIQVPVLGQAVDVVDDDGKPVAVGQDGELVCTSPFPSMPLGFWGDDDGARLRAAYFERFPGAWHQGDFARWTDHGGIVISGRSDATLNAGGVRIGTAEIYRRLDLVPEVADAVVVGQEWDDDTRLVLFVVLRQGAELTTELEQRIRHEIRTGATPRHVPARIVAVPDLPRTRTNKPAELAVRHAVAGRPVDNVEALANPEALEHVRNRPELAR